MADPSVNVDIGDIITASGVVLGSLLAWASTQRGKKTERAEKAVAEEMERREQHNDDREDEFARLERENVRLYSALDRERGDRERERAETKRWLDERLAQSSEDLASERAARAAERSMYLDELQRGRDDYAALAAMVRGQADEEAAGEDRQIVRAHLTSDSGEA